MKVRDNAEEVRKLRERGYRVLVTHHRFAKKDGTVKPRRGATVVCVSDYRDNFNKKLGLRIALGRALEGVPAE